MSRQDVSGLLSASSHMFYLSKGNKIFILRLCSHHDEAPIHVICSLSTRLLATTRDICKTLLINPPLGKKLSISHLKQIVLHKNSKNETTAFQLCKMSTISIYNSPDIDLSPPWSNLFTYRGIVTYSHPESGLYILDKTVYMTTSFLCAVTNVPSIPIATEVTIHNAHLAKFKGQKWLILCGAGFVQLHQDLEDLQVHPAEQDINRSILNPVINILQDGGEGWSCEEMLLLIENYRNLEKCFSGNIRLDELLRVSLRNIKSKLSRSLTKEFIDHPNFCSLNVLSNSKHVVRPFMTLEQLSNLIYNNFNALSEDEVQEMEMDFDVQGESSLLIGILQLDHDGRIVLKDETADFLMIGDFKEELGHFLEIQKLTIFKEKDGNFFLNVHQFKNLGTFEKIPSTISSNTEMPKSCRRNCLVIAKGPVRRDDQNGFNSFLIFCEEEEQGKMILRIRVLTKYLLIRQDSRLIFSHKSSCFKKIDQFSSKEFEAKNVVGQIPWFEVREEVTLDLEERNKSIPTLEYTLANVGLIPDEEIVNIKGLVVSIEDDDTKNLSDRKILLILADQVETESSHYTFYLSLPAYPLCLLPGAKVEVTSVIKTISRKGQTYFQSSYFTTVNFISPPSHSHCGLHRTSLNLLNPRAWNGNMVELLMSVERVLSMTVLVECGGCNSAIVSGRCSYIGCNVDRSYEFTFKATFEMLSDETCATLVTLAEEDIIAILNCAADVWTNIKKEATMSGKITLKDNHALQQTVCSAVATASYVCIRARRLTGEFQTVHKQIKLFCLKAWRLKNTQLNHVFEQLLGT